MATNPYLVNNYPGKFKIAYEGMAGDLHAFRVHLRGHKSMDVHMFKNSITEWLLDHCEGRWFFGNGSVPFVNENSTDFFVCFADVTDIVAFEANFVVVGFTPSIAA